MKEEERKSGNICGVQTYTSSHHTDIKVYLKAVTAGCGGGQEQEAEDINKFLFATTKLKLCKTR